MPLDRTPARVPMLAARWMARVLSLGVFAILFAFIGEGTPTPKEWLLIALFPLGLVAGLALAWWREIPGALVALVSMAAFYAVGLLTSGHLPTGPYLPMLASPAVLFLIAGVLARGNVSMSPRKPCAS